MSSVKLVWHQYGETRQNITMILSPSPTYTIVYHMLFKIVLQIFRPTDGR